MRFVLLATSALVSVALAVPAFAKEEGGENGITEIVVTAQKKEESLQKAGIAVDAVSATSLSDRGVTSATELTKAVPAISLPAAGGSIASIFLRGVGNITVDCH